MNLSFIYRELFCFFPIALRNTSASPFEEVGKLLRKQHHLFLIHCNSICIFQILFIFRQVVFDRFPPVFTCNEFGMYSIGPGRYNAFIAMRSSNLSVSKSADNLTYPHFQTGTYQFVSPADIAGMSWDRFNGTFSRSTSIFLSFWYS